MINIHCETELVEVDVYWSKTTPSGVPTDAVIKISFAPLALLFDVIMKNLKGIRTSIAKGSGEMSIKEIEE